MSTMLKFKLNRRTEVLTTSDNPHTRLQHTDGRSAEYQITFYYEPAQMTWKVVAIFGKINTGLKQQTIGNYSNKNDAKKLYSRKIQEKLKKGYQIVQTKL